MLARLWYAECLSRMGRHDEAIDFIERQRARDPVSPIIHNLSAMLFWRSHRYDEAIRSSQHSLDLDPNLVNALWWQSLAYAGKREFPKAIAAITRSLGR